jgi:hypothetical protein
LYKTNKYFNINKNNSSYTQIGRARDFIFFQFFIYATKIIIFKLRSTTEQMPALVSAREMGEQERVNEISKCVITNTSETNVFTITIISFKKWLVS